MALVGRLEQQTLERDGHHSEVDCTYSIVHDSDGKKCLQIDTYGSKTRQIPGKKSQSIRFTPEALQELKAILESHF
ncbi:methionyl-tRNA formyltransferase [Acidipila sp. EB88]|nr:methionyl-tRNA formyltransferase [Acidipila sp. EB88]